MPSTVRSTKDTQSARVEQRIDQHKAEVARLREQIGDPAAALSEFIRDRFEPQALVPDDPLAGNGAVPWWAQDDDADAW